MTDRQTESDAYEAIVQYAQVGSKIVMSEEKIKTKSKSLYFFLVGHNFSPSERSSSMEYNFCGLRAGLQAVFYLETCPLVILDGYFANLDGFWWAGNL